MHLKSIKLAGFKSFVDPTTILFVSNLTAIVGPNGCGKSNVIDAVRWVMGESSAKYLRGESMADVIFNGANDRKPISQASVELIFDNPAGRLGGNYAQYSELAIKRLVTRDNQSLYYLNGSRCRRKDIMDIFLGTGLGPRSYAIIGQGTVSRLIEAKPDELRVFIEEAAGISKYKERRKETEQRMQHTRDNLERLKDLQTELDKQLDKLQQQAKTAEKFQRLQAELRLTRQQMIAMTWQSQEQQWQTQQQQIRQQEVALEALVTERVHSEAQYEQLRCDQQTQADITQQQQEAFYLQGTELATLEQSIAHSVERLQRLNKETQDTEQALTHAKQQQQQASEQLEGSTAQLAQLTPTLEAAQQQTLICQEQLAQYEDQLQTWQQQWDQFNQVAYQVEKTVQVQQAHIQQIDKALLQLQQRQQRLQQEQQQLADQQQSITLAERQEQLAILQAQQHDQQALLHSCQQLIREQREQNRQYQLTLDPLKQQIRSLLGRKSSLETLQESALGKDQASAPRSRWLQQHHLQQVPRLGELLKVNSGWETAVECVLGASLQALQIKDMDTLLGQHTDDARGLRFIEDEIHSTASPPLSHGDSIHGNGIHGNSNTAAPAELLAIAQPLAQQVQPTLSLLAGVWAAKDLDNALQARALLPMGHSVITPEGIWLGADWSNLPPSADANQGVLQRQQQLSQLHSELELQQAQQQQLEAQWQQGREQLNQAEQQERQLQPQLQQLQQQLNRCQAEVSTQLAKQDQLTLRRAQIDAEIHDIIEDSEQDHATLKNARHLLEQALDEMAAHTEQRQQLKHTQIDYQQALRVCREQNQHAKDQCHQLQLQRQALLNGQQHSQQQLTRLASELNHLQQKHHSLLSQANECAAPQQDWIAQRERLLRQRLAAEKELLQARQQLADIETSLSQIEQRKRQIELQLQSLRQLLEQQRLQAQTLQVEREHQLKQLAAEETTPDAVLQQLPAHATLDSWQQQLHTLQQRIDKLGAINLAALSEYASTQERYDYMQTQYADLQEALTTLESAIRKIDAETKQRFQDTFDSVNKGFQALFPKVFAGGQAYLALTGDDLLETGVTVMARPPGKRNSSIHSLSGGEKALTAIALVFAIFELNPAPFCMLDEVDAPLDDANVGRFCRLVEEMALRIQFIYITHNKVAMEMAQQLMGVTMAEAGVSRLVSVDIEAAAAMATV
jgi:chromosome segregation protein